MQGDGEEEEEEFLSEFGRILVAGQLLNARWKKEEEGFFFFPICFSNIINGKYRAKIRNSFT